MEADIVQNYKTKKARARALVHQLALLLFLGLLLPFQLVKALLLPVQVGTQGPSDCEGKVRLLLLILL